MAVEEQYAVWCPEMGESEHEDEKLVPAYNAKAAAESYAEDSYYEEAFDSEMVVETRGPYGERQTYGVTPEPTVYFSARSIS